MMDWLMIINDGAVGLFGAILSAAFCQIEWNRRRKACCGAVIALLAALQVRLFVAFGAQVLRLWYPLIMHIPLALLLGWLSGRRLWGATAVLIAYLCCQLRRWLALACVTIFSGGEGMQAAVELAVTLPLAFALIRWAAPSVRAMSSRPLPMQIQFSLIPAVQYGFDYLTCVYTDLLISGVAAAVEFMPFVCAVAYLVFTLNTTERLRRQSELEQIQTGLDMQLRQSVRQIDELRKSQELAAQYRHDLRHHLQYLSSCMENGEILQAQEYIRRLDDAITRQTVQRYCANIPANLVLSAYAGRAEAAGVEMKMDLRVGETIRIADEDLCVLLSNALENALKASAAAKAAGKAAAIELRGYEREGRLFLEISNGLSEIPTFADGIPMTTERGHGLGVRSICAVVEKYGGIYSFQVEDGQFILRMSL